MASFNGRRSKKDIEIPECHFKWKPVRNRMKIPEVEKDLLKDLEEKPFRRIETFLLLGYVLTLDPETFDLKKVNQYFANALEEAGEAEDKRFVAEANLVMCQMESGKSRGTDTKLKQLHEKWLQWETREPQKTAHAFGCHALALSKYGNNKTKEAICLYEKAIERDPDNWKWSFEKALLVERERTSKFMFERPSDETLDLYRKAMKQPGAHAYVQVHYALCLIALYYSDYKTPSRHESKQQNSDHDEGKLLENEILDLLQKCKVEALRTGNRSVLKRCMKGFKYMKCEQDLEECRERIENTSLENETALLHRKARYYMAQKNYSKAKEFLEKSVEATSDGNVWASIDLIKVKIFLREDVDIDNEYGKLINKYQGQQYMAEIHQNWALSLQKKTSMAGPDPGAPDTALEEIIFHYREAITYFKPKIVQKKIAWNKLEKLCEIIVQYGKNRLQLAYRTLGWMYYIPEPKTKENLEKARENLASLEQDELEQDDIELYGDVLYELKQYDRALEQFEKLEDSHGKKCFHQGKCFFQLGEQQLNAPEAAKDLFLKSVQYGCLDACEKLLQLVEGGGKHTMYETCGCIKNWMYDQNIDLFSLTDTVESKRPSIVKHMEVILGISNAPGLEENEELGDSFVEIRKILLLLYQGEIQQTHSADDMTTVEVNEICKVFLENAKDVLTKSRSVLDHLHNKLQAKLNPESKDKVYFPLITDKQRPKNKSPGSLEAKDWSCENITKRFKNDFGDKDGSKGVADKCKDLIDFIALHQPYTDPERYDWLYDAWDVVNVIKHQKNITEIEYIIPGNGHNVNLVDLAKMLSLYAEEMLTEYCTVF